MSMSGVLHRFSLCQVVHAHRVLDQFSGAEHAIRQPREVSSSKDERAIRTELDNLIIMRERAFDRQNYSLDRDVLDIINVHFFRVFLININFGKGFYFLSVQDRMSFSESLFLFLSSFSRRRHALFDMSDQILVRPRLPTALLRTLENEGLQNFADSPVYFNQRLAFSAGALPLGIGCDLVLRTFETVEALTVGTLLGLVDYVVADLAHEMLQQLLR